MESNFSLLLGVATIGGGAVTVLTLVVGLAGIPWIRRQIRTGIEEAIRERTEEELSKSIHDLISELRREYEPKIVELLKEYESTLKRKG